MKVLKFGGTSVGTVKSLTHVKRIVESEEEPVIVVVSALGGITDMLIATARMASKGDTSYLQNYAKIIERHNDVINGMVPKDKLLDVHSVVDPLLEELGNIYRGVALIKDLSSRSLDIIVSYGERLSSAIISRIIDSAQYFDSRNFIKTVRQFNKHVVDFPTTESLVRSVFDRFSGNVAVVPGFISSDKENGDITNLGRGGSDYTASIIAASLNARLLEIWTDVDGFMTADPRVISNAYVIDQLSFVEAMELCNFGAKVVYPPTIYPVFHKNIPIIIKNTFNSAAPGTKISNDVVHEDSRAIKGISSISDTSLVTVSGLGMVGVIGINSRIFQCLAQNGISVFLVSQASSGHNTTFALKSDDADLAVAVLNKEVEKEIEIGEIFNSLGRSGISVIACAQGASETNISFVVNGDNLRKTLNVIHDSFFLSEYQVLNLFIVGVGHVGKRLIEQIRHQQSNLKDNKALELNVVGVANSHHCIFDRNGIDIEHYADILGKSEMVASPTTICDEIIKMNIFNPVFVDCTATKDIAAMYDRLLSHNVNVVAANKLAASSKYDNYKKLKQIARKRDVKFLFETNVGAGLPIINTINSLINSGDKILKIEAVLSGTLNYIFNVLSEKVPLSKAVMMAKEAGYSEPDPREDLSGKDVVRKLVILSREAGYRIETEDVKKNLFVPESLMQGTTEDFFKNIASIDDEFEKRRAATAQSGRALRFVARLENGEATVGLEEVASDSPFYSLESSNNVILITTERYKEYPMEIKGYGAGAEVTAAGVFADIISIANIR